VAVSPDHRYLLVASGRHKLVIYPIDRPEPLLTLFIDGRRTKDGAFVATDWIAWTPQGYYAASPGGEQRMGWVTDNGPDRFATFHPAARFRKLRRPDVIRLLLKEGSVDKALAAVAGKGARADDVSQVLPPRVALVVDRARLPQVIVTATGLPAQKGQPVVALQLNLDGRPAPQEDRLRTFTQGKEPKASWTVKLEPGRHRLSVLARSAVSEADSEEVEVVVGRPGKPHPTLHVVAVGINTYKDKNLTLRFARGDAEQLVGVLARRCQAVPFSQVKPTRLLDPDATRDKILQALRALKKAKPADVALVYFSGHGLKTDDGDLYLLPVDADLSSKASTARTCLSGKQLRQVLAEVPCRVLLVLDACHANAIIPAHKRPVEELTRILIHEDCAVIVLSAAMPYEEAGEKGGHGLFTRALIEGLTLPGAAGAHPVDQMIYLHHLYSYVFDAVTTRSHGFQHPFLNLPRTVHSFALAAKVQSHSMKEGTRPPQD
jgi:hypothetical protein